MFRFIDSTDEFIINVQLDGDNNIEKEHLSIEPIAQLLQAVSTCLSERQKTFMTSSNQNVKSAIQRIQNATAKLAGKELAAFHLTRLVILRR